MVYIFESHPIQYKAPVYQRLQQLRPDSFEVIYATDASVRGHRDREFAQSVTWDTPLMQGYTHRVLHNERGVPMSSFRSLTARGIFNLLRKERPTAAIIAPFVYEFDTLVYLSCLLLSVSIWIKHETQDEAFLRPPWKNLLRSIFYRLAYLGTCHAFFIGELNREHLLRHGISPSRMTFAPLGSPVESSPMEDRFKLRDEIRKKFGVREGDTVLLFSGKLIEKKNPGLILEAVARLPEEKQARTHILFLGAGHLEQELRAQASTISVPVHFTGFVNQSEIAGYYLAADILLLPSRRAGETWGLVVNEALQAGCSVIITPSVGCHRDFGNWERVRVIPVDDAAACSLAIMDLDLPRSFDWCADLIKNYSIDVAAQAIARQIDALGMK